MEKEAWLGVRDGFRFFHMLNNEGVGPIFVSFSDSLLVYMLKNGIGVSEPQISNIGVLGEVDS